MAVEQSMVSGKPRASVRLLLSISLLIVVVWIVSIAVINWQMKSYARAEAKEKAMILLDRNLATHTYFSHQLKTALFRKFEGQFGKTYFDPAWMSSTYAVREIDKYYQDVSRGSYYYKEAAINARSPENEADGFERAFIEKINQLPELTEEATVRYIDGRPFYVVLRRGEKMEQGCLRCHSVPKAAPADMVAQYGPDRSFGRSADEVVSAISIRIPIDEAYSGVNRLIVELSVVFGVTLLVVFGLSIWFGKRWVFDPLKFLHLKAREIGNDPDHLGEQIDLPSGRELAELTEEFNAMSAKLRLERDLLELKILERTEALNNANQALLAELDRHKVTIGKLEESLREIKTLRGILPICAHCKKIRNDQGYWDQIELYVKRHSEADFSHGICPECARKYYPEIDLYDDEASS